MLHGSQRRLLKLLPLHTLQSLSLLLHAPLCCRLLLLVRREERELQRRGSGRLQRRGGGRLSRVWTEGGVIA